ncbi:MAG: oligosaccharyl transferase, archaeosortase A system-associated [Dehalococcoidia bacterium]|nr:oligosaccharyl transferase, archaeosortase A system-associated [Dehalococcoidia bacterium]
MYAQFVRKWPSSRALVPIALLVIAGISLYIRIALPYDQIFVNSSVWFRGVDAWYHMRLVDNLIPNFPHLTSFDPYTHYPYGNSHLFRPLTDLLVASTAQIAGLGSPSQHTVDTIGAYLPPVLGTLLIIPVYFIGKELFNRWVGLLSAALLAILPGEFLSRSLLGFTDHHVAESLFSTVAILFLILAIKAASSGGLSFKSVAQRDWPALARPLAYTLLAGVSLGLYLVAWRGALMLIFIISLYVVIQFVIDHLRGRQTDYLCIVASPALLIASIMVLPVLSRSGEEALYRASLPLAVMAPLALSGISRFMAGRAMKPSYYPLALVGLVAAALAGLHVLNPALLDSMLHRFGIFAPSGASLTITEVHPLLFPGGNFSLEIAWLNFTTSFFISIVSLGLLVFVAIRTDSPDRTLFLVWSGIMLVAVLGQRRFGYYYAINAALLTGYISWRILNVAGLRKLYTPLGEAAEAVRKTKKRAEARARRKYLQQRRSAWMKVTVAGIAVFALVFFPNIDKARAFASEPSLMTSGWYSSLEWLRDNSPDPFGNPDSYYELHRRPPPGDSYEYPESAYGIMAWWDYGHWISRISHRIPVSNPFQQGATTAALFFTAQDEDSANEMMDDLGCKFVIVDNQMPTSKLNGLLAWADQVPEDFYGVYYQLVSGDKLSPVTLYYPTYYRSIVVRLYNFGGKAAVPEQSRVISYEWKTSREGIRYREITNSESFDNYEDAADYLAGHESEDYRIVSSNPLSSPVPLGALARFKPVHQSESTAKIAGNELPEVMIFEYAC